MEFEIKEKPKSNREHFLDKDIDLVEKISEKAKGLFDKLIASVLILRGETNSAVVVIDDFNNTVLNQQINDMKVKLAQACFQENIDMDFSMMLISDFWKHYKQRTTPAFNILRNSYIIYDIGVMRPLQELFEKGKIRPSKEAVNYYFFKAEKAIKNSNRHLNTAVIDIYWAVVDVAHAAVMMAGYTPPSPKELAEVLRKDLVAKGLLHKRCADIMENIFETAKKIMHKEVWTITGKEFDKHVEDAEFFIEEATRFIKKYQTRQPAQKFIQT